MKNTKRVIPYWEAGTDWSQEPFFIKRLENHVPLKASEVPRTVLPVHAFTFLLEGEFLADIGGDSLLCRGGQFLLYPANKPFSINYFKDLVGYTGCFNMSFLPDMSHPCLTSPDPVLHTFWFDEAAFIAELLDRVMAAYSRGDVGYFSRAFDLILYSIKAPEKVQAHPLVNRFMGMIFDRSEALDTVSGYAARLNISPSYLNKLVRTQTRHSAMDWVEIARVNWAKCLLKKREMSIGEVSAAIGVDDPSYFTRFFRKSTGMTPSEFRRHVTGKPKEE